MRSRDKACLNPEAFCFAYNALDLFWNKMKQYRCQTSVDEKLWKQISEIFQLYAYPENRKLYVSRNKNWKKFNILKNFKVLLFYPKTVKND